MPGIHSAEGTVAPPVAARRQPLVIVADPDGDAVNIVQCLGERAGYQVRATSHGMDAWRLIRAFQPNLVVLNRRLVEINGLQLARQIRAHPDPAISDAPILVTDTLLYVSHLREYFWWRVDDFLEKPFSEGTLRRCWRRLIGGARRPAPLTALLNENGAVRDAALSCLLEVRPPGLVDGLRFLLWQPAGRDIARAALAKLGTPDARAVLQEETLIMSGGV